MRKFRKRLLMFTNHERIINHFYESHLIGTTCILREVDLQDLKN